MEELEKVSAMESEELVQAIGRLKGEKKAVIMAHYYQRPEVQAIADRVGDSLALARYAATTDADMIVMCGVHFMGETAKILCPDKRVVVPGGTEAGCSLADSCDAREFEAFIKAHPGHTVISYVNTSARVKALTDIVVTSGNALKIVSSLPSDEKIIFGPDHNLGDYINSVTGRQMLLWPGACHVHDRFSLEAIIEMKKAHSGAKVLVHPECRRPLQIIADKVGSTAALLDFARNDSATEFIVVTESGILHEMQRSCPGKRFLPAPPQQAGCACNECEYMKIGTLRGVYEALLTGEPEVKVDPQIARAALRPIERMLELSK